MMVILNDGCFVAAVGPTKPGFVVLPIARRVMPFTEATETILHFMKTLVFA
jgi:hypothetical protein